MQVLSNPELQLEDTESKIKNKLIQLLTQLKGFKFVATLFLVFKKIESSDKTKYDHFYLSSKAEIIINESDIDDVFQSIYTTIIKNIQKSLGKGSGWIIDSVIDRTINISKYNPLAGSSYIKLPKELDHPRKESINIQNIDDNECFNQAFKIYSASPTSNNELLLQEQKRSLQGNYNRVPEEEITDMVQKVELAYLTRGWKILIKLAHFALIKKKSVLYAQKTCKDQLELH